MSYLNKMQMYKRQLINTYSQRSPRMPQEQWGLFVLIDFSNSTNVSYCSKLGETQ